MDIYVHIQYGDTIQEILTYAAGMNPKDSMLSEISQPARHTHTQRQILYDSISMRCLEFHVKFTDKKVEQEFSSWCSGNESD